MAFAKISSRREEEEEEKEEEKEEDEEDKEGANASFVAFGTVAILIEVHMIVSRSHGFLSSSQSPGLVRIYNMSFSILTVVTFGHL